MEFDITICRYVRAPWQVQAAAAGIAQVCPYEGPPIEYGKYEEGKAAKPM